MIYFLLKKTRRNSLFLSMSPWRLSIGNSTLPPPTKNNALSFYLGLPLSSRAYLLKILASFFGQMKCRDTVMHVQKKSFSLPDSFIPFFASPDQVLQITHTQKKKTNKRSNDFYFPAPYIYLFILNTSIKIAKHFFIAKTNSIIFVLSCFK